MRTHQGGDDCSYSCVTQEEDAKGKVGIALSKELMAVAGNALKVNISTLGPLVFPIPDPEERPQAQDQELRPRLQAGGRALLHPRRRPRSAGRAREEPRADSTPRVAVEDDAAQVRQHLQQLHPVRAILLRGQRPDEHRRPGVADRVRVRVQVQQCRLESPPHRRWRSQESMDGGDRQVSGARAEGVATRPVKARAQTQKRSMFAVLLMISQLVYICMQQLSHTFTMSASVRL